MDEDDPGEQPVGDLWVNYAEGSIRLPNGAEARHFHDHDYTDGLVEEDAIREIPLSWLAEAFSLVAEHDGPTRWYLGAIENPHNYDDPEIRTNVVLDAHGLDTLDVVVEVDGLARYYDEAFEASIPALLKPLLARWGAQLGNRGRPVEGPFLDGCVGVAVRLPTGGHVGADAIQAGAEASALLNAARRGPISRATARDLILAGFAGSLVGLHEGEWIDVKKAPYRLDADRDRYDLARDVAGFANASGGIVFVPATTRLDRNGEVVDDVRDLDLDLIDVLQLRQTIADWIYPAVAGLEVVAIETNPGRGHLMVHIPPQAPEDWPHVVTRTNMGDRIRTTGLAIPVRHGAEIRALDPAAMHALLRAGKQRPSSSETRPDTTASAGSD